MNTRCNSLSNNLIDIILNIFGNSFTYQAKTMHYGHSIFSILFFIYAILLLLFLMQFMHVFFGNIFSPKITLQKHLFKVNIDTF